MPTMRRKTKRKKEMPSKELLLVMLHVSGLELVPRWLLKAKESAREYVVLKPKFLFLFRN